MVGYYSALLRNDVCTDRQLSIIIIQNILVSTKPELGFSLPLFLPRFVVVVVVVSNHNSWAFAETIA